MSSSKVGVGGEAYGSSHSNLGSEHKPIGGEEVIDHGMVIASIAPKHHRFLMTSRRSRTIHHQRRATRNRFHFRRLPHIQPYGWDRNLRYPVCHPPSFWIGRPVALHLGRWHDHYIQRPCRLHDYFVFGDGGEVGDLEIMSMMLMLMYSVGRRSTYVHEHVKNTDECQSCGCCSLECLDRVFGF